MPGGNPGFHAGGIENHTNVGNLGPKPPEPSMVMISMLIDGKHPVFQKLRISALEGKNALADKAVSSP